MKKHIPNTLTLANLFCGCIAIYLVIDSIINKVNYTGDFGRTILESNFKNIAILIFLSSVFDFADGLVARALNVKSELGAQLDSLADMVTFGVFPGFLMVWMLDSLDSKIIVPFTGDFPFILFGLLITLFSALRLAKFNIDDNQTENFKGLAVPANTLFILSLSLVLIFNPKSFLSSIINNQFTLIIITLISSYLLVSNIPMFSFKMKNFNFNENIHRYILLIISIILLLLFKIVALPLIVIIYIILSIIFKNKFA